MLLFEHVGGTLLNVVAGGRPSLRAADFCGKPCHKTAKCANEIIAFCKMPARSTEQGLVEVERSNILLSVLLGAHFGTDEGEDVDPHGFVQAFHWYEFVLDNRSPSVEKLCEGPVGYAILNAAGIEVDMIANTLTIVDELNEPVIVFFRHRDVDVVVPGDEALVARSAEQGSVYEPIAKIMFLGEIVKGAEHLEFDVL